MRLIDADKISYERAHLIYPDGSECLGYRAVASSVEIKAAPTVDAVEVVRCKDCAKDGLFTCPICFIENKTLHFINHSPDFYCGEGERKDGDSE